MWGLRSQLFSRLAALAGLALGGGSAFAAAYSLPSGFGSAPFAGCTLTSGTTYTCGAITTGNNNTITVTSSLTINASSFNLGTGSVFNVASGVSVTISVTTGGAINIGNNSSITANLTGTEDMIIGTNATVIGNISVPAKTVQIGNGAAVFGSVTTGTLDFGGGGSGRVYGSCTPSSANCVTSAALVDWHFDETAWAGTSGEVKDSSANARNATAQGGATTTTPGALCGAGSFTGSGYVTAGAINLGIGGTSGFTAMAWVKWGIDPATAPTWANIFSNNASNTSDSGQFWLQHSSNNSKFEFALKSANNRSFVQSNTSTAQGVWQHVAGTYDGANLRMYVNGVLENTTALTGAIGPFVNTYTLDAARWGYSTAPRQFTGAIDEVLAFGSGLSAGQIKAIYTFQSQGKNWNGTARSCPVVGPNHVEIVHNGSALTCSPKAVTVLACTTSASCNGVPANQYGSTFTITPGAIAGGQWCSDAVCSQPISGSVTLSNNATLYVRDPTARTDTLAATVSAATNTTVQCTNTATGATNAASACNLSFAAAGFLVSAPNHVSCTAQNITLQAVQSNATATACVPALQGVARNVALSSLYANPASGTRTASLNYVTSAGGATSTLAALSTSQAAPSTLSGLYFDNTGTARISNFVYPDVGQLTLYPVYSGSVATGDNGLALSAVSGNTLIAAPASFGFGSVAAPQVAGVPFTVSVTARNACATPAAAPNFGRESTPATVALSSGNPVPAAGNATPIAQTLGGFTNGVASASLNWNEVGTFDLTALSANYLGSGLSASSALAGVGRFIPSYFDTVVTPACASFSYSGQPFTTTITAHAAAGTVTANYAGSTWAKAVTLSDANAVAGSMSNAAVAASAFSAGVATGTPSFGFTSRQTAPAMIALRALDTDAVTSTLATQGTTSVRSGRLRILNAYGNGLVALPVALTTEYWNGNGYALNAADNCTLLPVPAPGSGLVFGGALSAGMTLPAMHGVTSGTGSVVAGDAGFVLSAPGANRKGYVDITIASPTWLTYPWHGATASAPTGRASFGIYKTPIIYMRENY